MTLTSAPTVAICLQWRHLLNYSDHKKCISFFSAPSATRSEARGSLLENLDTYRGPWPEWRRYVIKYGDQLGQQTVSDYTLRGCVNDFQTITNPGSRQPVGASTN